MAIRVIAVDDHPLILKALTDLFKEHTDIQLVATSNQGSQLLKMVRETHPDVAIIDLGMEGDSFDPISAVKNLHEQHPKIKILILTGYNDGLWVQQLVKAGASGYMLKNDDFSLSIPQAVRSVYAGGKFFSPGIMDKLFNGDVDVKLTNRELSVLHLLSRGLSTDTIADNLGVSEKRIRNVLVKVCDKLSVDRADGVDLRISAIKKSTETGTSSGRLIKSGTIVPNQTGQLSIGKSALIIYNTANVASKFVLKSQYIHPSGVVMDKEKVTQLAKSLSAACKQAVHDKQLIQKLSSPQAAMLVLSVLAVTANAVDPKSKWA